MKKIALRIIILTFVWGLFLSLINHGWDGVWRIVTPGSAVVMLLFILFVGLGFRSLDIWGVTLGVYLILMVIMCIGLAGDLAWWKVVTNVIVATGFYLYGVMCFYRHVLPPRLFYYDLDGRTSNRFFR
jgi:hypothetical protein